MNITKVTLAIILGTAQADLACDNSAWLKRYAQAHHTDIAAAAAFLDSHPAKAAKLDAKCKNAKKRKKHKHPTPIPHAPTPSPTATPPYPIPTPTIPPPTPSPTPTPTPVCTPPDERPCVYSRDFWHDHPEQWPILSVKIGNVTYIQAQCLTIMAENPGNPPNGLISVGGEEIAAKLNIANSAPQTCSGLNDAIAAFDVLVGNLIVPPFGNGFIAQGNVQNYFDLFSNYNKGNINGCDCGKHCQ